MKLLSKGLLIVLSAIVLWGCQTTATPEGGAKVEDRSGAADGASTGAASEGGTFSGDPLDDPSSPLSQRIVYFDLDSSEIKAEDHATVTAHGKYLVSNPNASVTLEGHADERGSREYNLALGERRSNTVRQLLLAEGATAQQIQTVSYGEEKPADPEHNEDAWSLNRRVEFVYNRK
ncbi:MAG TPA: peptidoglycan-associated lipoprotein Pal [Gammaproteobacteria bacterium]|nr:peptidoglycan-associated lipoprotein Pal [Gammaproteobacteria bacterium]